VAFGGQAVGESGDAKNLGIRVKLPDVRGQLRSIDTGHADVGDHEAHSELALREEFQRSSTVLSGKNIAVACLAQHCDDHYANRVLIVNDQNLNLIPFHYFYSRGI
jgi:hypothetical protein